MKLRDYQLHGVEHLSKQQRALLLDDQGLGKTAQALAALNKLGPKRSLIICPPAVRYGWELEAHRWTARDYKIHVMTRMNEWIPEWANIVIVSDSLLSSPMIVDQLNKQRWGVLIIDEVHRFKSTKANRTQALLGGRKRGIISSCTYAWALSGTPMTARPVDLWPMFRSMGKNHLPEKTRTYDGFTKVFCKRYKTRWGHWDVSGAANLPVLRNALFKTGFALRRTKEQVLTELPDKTYRIMPMTMTDTNAEVKWGDKLRAADFKKSNLGLDASELAEARKDLGMAKRFAVLDYINDIDEPLVVFGHHREFLEVIASGCDSVLYYGGMTPSAKEKAKRDFIDGRAKVFVANITSAGTGLDGLQHRSSHALFAEIPWNYSDIAQAADRIHRMGQKNKVLIDLMVLKGGVESYIMNTVMKKEGLTAELLLDGTGALSKLLTTP